MAESRQWKKQIPRDSKEVITVRELVAELLKCNQDAIVKVDDWNEGYAPANMANVVRSDADTVIISSEVGY